MSERGRARAAGGADSMGQKERRSRANRMAARVPSPAQMPGRNRALHCIDEPDLLMPRRATGGSSAPLLPRSSCKVLEYKTIEHPADLHLRELAISQSPNQKSTVAMDHGPIMTLCLTGMVRPRRCNRGHEDYVMVRR
jgi:hypothetical protein